MNKVKMKVTLITDKFRITGHSYVDEGFRITGYLNMPAIYFIPLTEVTVFTLDGQVFSEEKFLCVNKDKITFITSEE